MSVYIDWGDEVDGEGWRPVTTHDGRFIEKESNGVTSRIRVKGGPHPRKSELRASAAARVSSTRRRTFDPETILECARPEDIELRTDRLSPIGVDLRCGKSRIVDEVLEWARDGSGSLETGGYLYGRRHTQALNRLDGPSAVDWLDVEFVAHPGPDTERRAQSVIQDSGYARSTERSPLFKRQGWCLIGDYHSHPTYDTQHGLPSQGDCRGWFRSLQLLADKSGPATWRLGSETTIDAWLGIIVTRSEGGSWTYPKLHAWITRVDRDRIVCEPAALKIA